MMGFIFVKVTDKVPGMGRRPLRELASRLGMETALDNGVISTEDGCSVIDWLGIGSAIDTLPLGWFRIDF